PSSDSSVTQPVAFPEAAVEAACARALADPGLRPEALAGQIEELARSVLEAPPAEALTRLLAGLEEQSVQFVAQDDPGQWARQAVTRVREWLGPGMGSSPQMPGQGRDVGEWRKSRLNRALEMASQQAAHQWTGKLTASVLSVMELPGQRVTAG